MLAAAGATAAANPGCAPAVALAAVLDHDLRVVHDQNAEPRPCREAMDRLFRLGAPRITIEPPEYPSEFTDRIADTITQHATDPKALAAIKHDLMAPDSEEDER